MSVAPLFNADMESLKSKLRLSGAKSNDAQALIETAVQDARVGFYDRLGSSRIAEIVGYGLDNAPTTTNGLLRLKAANTEVKWVRALLIRSMPSLFIDGSQAAALKAWNEEGLTRNAGQSELNREVERLMTEVDLALAGMETGTPEEGENSVSLIGPDETQPSPFESITPSTQWV